jgi:hypothetical protein
MEYIVNKNNLGKYVKVEINNRKKDDCIKKLFTSNTIYGVELKEYNDYQTNRYYEIPRYCDIFWIDSILINSNDINELEYIEIKIGNDVIWKFCIKFIIYILDLKIHNLQTKISFPRSLFINNSNLFECLKLDNKLDPHDFVGIPIWAMVFHSVRINIIAKSFVKYDLIIKATFLKDQLHWEMLEKKYLINILQMEKILHLPINDNFYYLSKISNYIFNNALNSNNFINYFYNQKRKEYIVNLPILINVINIIISEYDITDEYTDLYIIDEQLINYHIFSENLIIQSGVGGILNKKYLYINKNNI